MFGTGLAILIAAALSADTSSFPQATSTAGPITVDTVSLLETNHFYDETGKLLFDQIIFWDWHPTESRYHVRAWRLVKSPQQLPIFDADRQCWKTTWVDGNCLREVRAEQFRESWTMHDPELLARADRPRDERRELTPCERVKVGEQVRLKAGQ